MKSSNILLAMVAKTVAPCLTSFQPVTIALKFSLCISHFWDPMQQEVSGCNALTRTVNPKVPGSRPERPAHQFRVHFRLGKRSDRPVSRR